MNQSPKIMPVAYLLATMMVMAGLDAWLPVVEFGNAVLDSAGWILVLAGFAVIVIAAVQFRSAGTTIRPFGRSTSLVTAGLFGFSRNPIYVGMVCALAGVSMLLGSVSAWVPIPMFAWLVQENVIRDEEALLEETFGDDYRAYKARVRRWV